MAMVLIIEDDELVRNFLVRALRDQKYVVVPAADGSEGLEIALDELHHIDAILLDVMMPGLDGIEVHRRIRAVRPDISIILMSGYPGAERITDLLRNDPNTLFLKKPFSAEKIIELLAGICSRAKKGGDTAGGGDCCRDGEHCEAAGGCAC